MQIKELFDDDRAVSPVIGVILMVAITVILAAVIGTFVLGLGDQVQQTTPQVQFGFEQTESFAANSPGNFTTNSDTTNMVNVSITHESGDTVSADEIEISATSGSSSQTWTDVSGSSGDVTAGSSTTVTVDSGDTVRVVYNNPDSDKTATLGKYET